MKRVLVSLSANSVASREFLTGVFNYVNAGHDWRINFQQNPNDLTPQLLKSFARDGLDGIVTGINRATPGYRTMISLGIPLALNNFPAELPPPDNPNIAVLRNDELAIGRAAAKLLRSKGSFRTYAFMPPEERAYWSVLRERGFRLELGKSKIIPIKFRMSETQLGAWLKSLPRPAAIFASYDMVAAKVIEACRAEKLRVPEQIAVVGVDNDEVVCNAMRPTLSSVHPNHVELARRAAAELDRLMHGRRMSAQNPILIPPIGVVERDSTRTVPPAGFIIREGLAFIRKNACMGIDVKDVARHLGVSESLARLRFRTVHGRSMRDEILDARTLAAERLLRDTKDSLVYIARETGFASACHLSHHFKKRHGMSPEAWRKKLEPENLRDPAKAL